MTVAQTTTLDTVARSPDGRLLLGMTEDRTYVPGGDEQLVEDLRQKVNLYVYALRSGQVRERRGDEPLDIVLFTASDPTPGAAAILTAADQALRAEGVTVSARRLTPPTPRSADDLQRVLVQELAAAMPQDAVSAQYDAGLVGEEARDTLQAKKTDGSVVMVDVPGHLRPLVAELKQAMWSPETGTWFSCRFFLDKAAGKVQPSFNSENDPWPRPFTAEDWRVELRHFPRPADMVPDWLRALVGS